VIDEFHWRNLAIGAQHAAPYKENAYFKRAPISMSSSGKPARTGGLRGDGGGYDHAVGFDAAELAGREIHDYGDFAADQFFRS